MFNADATATVLAGVAVALAATTVGVVWALVRLVLDAAREPFDTGE